MKKRIYAGALAVFLTFVAAFSPPGIFSVLSANAMELSDGQQAEEHFVDGNEISSVNDPVEVAEQISQNWEGDEYKESERATDYEEKYQLKRVIVKTGSDLENSFGATSCIYYEKSGEYILEYSSEKDTKNAYDKFRLLYGSDCVFTDRLISAQDAGAETTQTQNTDGTSVSQSQNTDIDNTTQPQSNGEDSIIQPRDTDTESTETSLSDSDYKAVSNGTSYLGLDKLKTAARADTTLGKITVAVLDTGIYQKHEMFADRTISEKSRSMISEGGMFLNLSGIRDKNGHGTHIAGIICDGTPEQVELLVIKIMDHNGYGSLYDARLAVDYAVENGASVINCSFGGEGYTKNVDGVPEMEETLRGAVEKGVLTVVASGNGDANGVAEDINAVYCYPAYSDYVVSVGAIGEGEKWMDWSNYGKSLDFVAPGEAVKSASIYGMRFYETKEGTSFASPFVSAAAAMVKLYHPDYMADEVMETLVENAVDVEEKGKDVRTGYGYIRLSSPGELSYKNTPIDYFNQQSTDIDNQDTVSTIKVADVSINKLTSGTKKFTVVWRKGTGKATGFQVRYSRKSTMASSTKKTISSSSTRKKTVSSLTSGKKYYVQVRAYYKKSGSSVRYGSWSTKKGIRV